MKALPGEKSGRLLSARQRHQPARDSAATEEKKKACKKPNHKDPSVGTQAVLPAVDSNMHAAIYSPDEYSFLSLRGFNNMEQMKDVSHPGILSGQQCIICREGRRGYLMLWYLL